MKPNMMKIAQFLQQTQLNIKIDEIKQLPNSIKQQISTNEKDQLLQFLLKR